MSSVELLFDSDDKDCFELTAIYCNGIANLYMTFDIEYSKFSLEDFLNGTIGISSNDSYNFSYLQLNSDGFFKYAFKSVLGGMPYITYLFEKGDPFIVELIEKLTKGYKTLQQNQKSKNRSTIQINIQKNEFNLWAHYIKDSIILHLFFNVNQNFLIDQFLKGSMKLMNYFGDEINGSQWSLKINSNGLYEYNLRSNYNGISTTSTTYTFEKDDSFILRFITQLTTGYNSIHSNDC
jgi:hypothetical protein